MVLSVPSEIRRRRKNQLFRAEIVDTRLELKGNWLEINEAQSKSDRAYRQRKRTLMNVLLHNTGAITQWYNFVLAPGINYFNSHKLALIIPLHTGRSLRMREKSRSQVAGAEWKLIHWKPSIDRSSSIWHCFELSLRCWFGEKQTPRSAFEQRISPRSEMFISFEFQFRLHTQQSPQWLQSKDWLMVL